MWSDFVGENGLNEHTLSPVLCSIVLGSTKHTANTHKAKDTYDQVVMTPLQPHRAGSGQTLVPGPVLLYCPAQGLPATAAVVTHLPRCCLRCLTCCARQLEAGGPSTVLLSCNEHC